jgi:hypothetical protein
MDDCLSYKVASFCIAQRALHINVLALIIQFLLIEFDLFSVIGVKIE